MYISKKSKSPIDQNRLWQFRYEMSSYNDFATLFEQVKDAMSLLSIDENAFIEIILLIEISGSKQSQLTIVDLSDLIYSHNKRQIKHDVKLMTNLIVKYMANPKNIILTVMFAKNDFSNQILRVLIYISLHNSISGSS